MTQEFDVGNEAYIIESNRIIRKCTIVRKSGDLYIIRFENGGGIQVKGHRLFIGMFQIRNSVIDLVGKNM